MKGIILINPKQKSETFINTKHIKTAECKKKEEGCFCHFELRDKHGFTIEAEDVKTCIKIMEDLKK